MLFKIIIMKNYSELNYDKSCFIFYHFFHQKECYKFPVVYDDGTVSQLKSSSEERTPCGILCKGYIVSIWQSPEKMTPQEATNYCKSKSIAWRPSCIPPRKVMRKLLKNVTMVNQIIQDLGGDLIEDKWYMVTNDTFTSSPAGYPLDDIMLGINLHHLDDYANRGGKICWQVTPNTKISFYPAAKI